MKHDYTNDEIRDAWKDSVSLCEFLDALPERPQAAEIAELKADLLHAKNAVENLMKQRDKAQGILKACLSVMPFGNIKTHTVENLPGRIADLASEIATVSSENERLEAELAKWHAELSAVMPADFKDWHQNDPAEWPIVAAQFIRNLRDREESALDMAEKAQAELAESQRKLSYAEEPLGTLAKTFGYEGRTWCNMVSYLAPRLQKAERDLAKAEAELAALRQPILADDGRSLNQVYQDAYNCHLAGNGLDGCCDAGVQAVAAVVEARMIRRMEAVLVEELRRVYHPRRSISEGLETVRARFIAAAKGEGQTEAKTQPATFEAHGKTWTRHTPGDPMPCDGGRKVFCISNSPDCYDGAMEAKCWSWGVEKVSIIGWRYADEPAQEEAISTEPEDKRLPPLNDADPVGHCAVEAACVHRKLDELGIPREEGGDELSLWGRVEEYAKAQPTQLQQAWTPAVGDTVRLKSGGPVMTLVQTDKFDNNLCSWFNESGKSLSIRFPAVCLIPAKP